MSNTMRRFLLIAAVCGGLCGCKSGPTWDWWRIGRSGTPESSPIARSAGPSLPSELAQQGNPSLVSQNLQVPVVESGSDQFAYGDQASGYSASTGGTMSNNAYPSTNAGYAPPARGTTGTFAGNYANPGSADPFSRGSATSPAMGTAPVQNGFYDPSAYTGPPAQTAMPSSASSADRYAYNPAQVGGAGANPAAYSGTSPAPYGGASSMGTSPAASGMSSATPWPPQASYANTSSGDDGRYIPPAGGGNVQVSQVDFGDPAASTNATADYTSGLASNAPAPSSSPAPYRPGGTSDYTGPENTSPVNVAARQGSQDAMPHTGNADGAAGGAPAYRYGAETPYADTGIGQRY